jgi:hypothetical protein
LFFIFLTNNNKLSLLELLVCTYVVVMGVEMTERVNSGYSVCDFCVRGLHIL